MFSRIESLEPFARLGRYQNILLIGTRTGILQLPSHEVALFPTIRNMGKDRSIFERLFQISIYCAVSSCFYGLPVLWYD